MRLAHPGDEERLWEFCQDGHADSGLFPASEAKVREVIWRGCNQGTPPCVIVVIEGRERIEASACLDSAQPWYSDAWVYHDRWLHVHYAHRRSRHLYKLMQFVRWWAERVGAPVFFGIESTTDLERKMKVYSHFGQCVGGAYGLNIPTVARPERNC